jgi:glycogen debranching enzyme
MPFTSNDALAVAGGALLLASIPVTAPVAAAAIATAAVAVAIYSWADGMAAEDKQARSEDLARVMRINDSTRINPIANYWNVSTSGISGAEAYVGDNGGVGWIDRETGNNYWHPDETFKPKQARVLWIQDKNSSAFPKTKRLF